MSNSTRRHSHSPNYAKYVLAASDPITWERFVARVNFATDSGCWEWTGSRNDAGYGIFTKWIDGRSMNMLAHRLALHIAKRPVPEDLTVDHLCRNTRCVRPEHLDIVTPTVNTLRGDGYYAVNGRKTHCTHGHEFTPENTYTYHSRRTRWQGWTRSCKTCAHDRYMARRTAVAR